MTQISHVNIVLYCFTGVFTGTRSLVALEAPEWKPGNESLPHFTDKETEAQFV